MSERVPAEEALTPQPSPALPERERVRELLEGSTPGEWAVELDDNICANYEFRDGKHVADWIAEVDHGNREDYQDDGCRSYSPQADCDADLIALAPTLARAYLAQAAELDQLRARAEGAEGEREKLREALGEVGSLAELSLNGSGMGVLMAPELHLKRIRERAGMALGDT